MSLSEIYVFGNYNVNCCHSYNLTIKHHINFNASVSLTGEYTVTGNACKTLIRYRPSITLGKICFISCCTYTLTGYINRCTDCCIAVITFNNCMIKLSRAGSSRNEHKRCRNRTLEAVRGAVNKAKLGITGLSCNKGRRSTTVKVYSLYTTCIQKDLCDFKIVTTARVRLLTSIQYHKNNLTGLGNTCCGSGCAAACATYTNFTVFNKSGTEASNSLLNLTLINSIVLLGSTYNGSTVLKDTKESVCID